MATSYDNDYVYADNHPDKPEPENHQETIKCPECESIQPATVEHTVPWFSYVHECTDCGYIIGESEWEAVSPTAQQQH